MKRVSEIIAHLPVESTRGDLSTLVRELRYDSRQVQAQEAFIAIRGFQHDGHRFLQQAYDNGCRVFIVEELPREETPLNDGTVIVQVKDTRRWLPFLARNFFDNVVDEFKIIGITGTNGKTTTAYLLHSMLKAAGWNPGLITSIENRTGKERIPAKRTTPESLDLYRLYYQMYRNGMKNAVMEVSSHALALHRVDGIPFTAAIFTNLGHDHLDFHKSIENYFLAKKKLFDHLHENARAIVNLDDPCHQRILEDTPADKFTYSAEDPRATVYLKSMQLLTDGMSVHLNSPSGTVFLSTALIGKFNVYNLMAAVTAAFSLGLQEEHIIKGVESLNLLPGRCERYLSPKGYRVYIDYAHGPEALQRMLDALLEFHPRRLTVVFGCGGDRDIAKRPKMGKIAEDYADRIILTSDNPRSEDPLEIIAQIRQGIYDQSKVQVVPDRGNAIETALRNAQKNEFILIAGKGHETYQEFADKTVHFDDHEVVEAVLKSQH